MVWVIEIEIQPSDEMIWGHGEVAMISGGTGYRA